MVRFLTPPGAPAAITSETPVTCVPSASGTGVPKSVIPDPESESCPSVVTCRKFVPVIVTGTVAPGAPLAGETPVMLVVALVTVQVMVSVAIFPLLSVTRSVTLKTPFETYVIVGWATPTVSNDPFPSRSHE